MTAVEIHDFLKYAERVVAQKNGELPPPDINTLREIETSTTDHSISSRIQKIREQHEHWVEHYEEPDDIETSLS